MEIPGRDKGIIPVEKIRDYLLAHEHPIGKFKAKFFYGLGYYRQNWKALAEDVDRILRQGSVTKSEETNYGIKYVVEGKLMSRSGISHDVVTVWIVRAGESKPRLITVYPKR